MSVAVVGAMAFAVSVQGSPRAGERGKTDGKSGASRLVTGPSAHINNAIAGGATATITLQPVPPKTVPATPTNGVIAAQTQTLASVPARVWIEVLYTGWAPETLKTVQVTLSATDTEMDGGGYFVADCAGTPLVYSPTQGGGGLFPAQQACLVSADCRGTISGIAGPCGVAEPSRCVVWDGVSPGGYFTPGRFCEPGFQNKCNPSFGAGGIAAASAADISSLNYRFGFAAEPNEIPTDFNPSYAGEWVLDVPANAKGTYTIDEDQTQTFLQNPNTPPDNNIPLLRVDPAIIKVSCGSCCTNLGPGTSLCTPGVSANECSALPNQPSVFRPDVDCSVACPACTANSDCSDGDACTQDICSNFVCSNPAVASWDQVNECCNAADGSQDALGCGGDQCQAASCTLPGNRGDSQCLPRTGLDCDDESPCTYADTCDAAGGCAGTDANAVPCVSSADCAAETGVGHACVDGLCKCVEFPDLDIEIIDLGGENCFAEGEKITAEITIGASVSPINGGQFLIGYDTSCLDYVSAAGIEPYTNAVYGPVVNEAAGTIFIAVGVEFGAGDGGNGGPMVSLSFIKRGECNSCQICPLNNNPMNTYLTDNEGQRITVTPSCSKAIYADAELDLTTPGPSIKTNVDCDRPTAVEGWDAPSATDTCGNATVTCRGEHESGLQYDSATVNGGGEFPIGASSFCCYAVSDGPCGSTVGCPPDTTCTDGDGDGYPDGCWTVTVNDETSLDITVGLSPTSQSKPGDDLTRCIKFTLYSNCVQEPLVFSDDVTFGGMFNFVGKSTGKIKIPGSGQWDCITAQDQLHTLRSCFTFASNGSDCVGGQLNASFSGDPRLGGNWLIGGNLDGWKKDDPNANPSLDVIDILDFGTFTAQYLANYGFTDTPCGTAGPNADINGDGTVDLDDYAFISANFLVSAKQCCCGPQTASANAVTEISVADLRAQGLSELAAGDINGDGMLNLADMASFDQGVRPTKKNTVKGGSRSTGSR